MSSLASVWHGLSFALILHQGSMRGVFTAAGLLARGEPDDRDEPESYCTTTRAAFDTSAMSPEPSKSTTTASIVAPEIDGDATLNVLKG